MKVGRWSTTPGSNNATPPDGYPEGQAPSTLNDCARENMAAIRTAFQDLQYFDQDYTPTYISATSFSVPGNQTSAIHAGRRLKLFSGNTLYGTVSTASFTTVTTIDLSLDSGSLTSSLSSFGISVLSNDNHALPRRTNQTISELTVVGGAGFHSGVGIWSTLTVSGAAVFKAGATFEGNISVSGTVVAANVAKAWVNFKSGTASSNAACVLTAKHNINTVSRSAAGVYKVTFTNALADANYAVEFTGHPPTGVTQPFIRNVTAQAADSFKFRLADVNGTTLDPWGLNELPLTLVFYR